MNDDDLRIAALCRALASAIAALELLMMDPANKSEISPDLSWYRAELEFNKGS